MAQQNTQHTEKSSGNPYIPADDVSAKARSNRKWSCPTQMAFYLSVSDLVLAVVEFLLWIYAMYYLSQIGNQKQNEYYEAFGVSAPIIRAAIAFWWLGYTSWGYHRAAKESLWLAQRWRCWGVALLVLQTALVINNICIGVNLNVQNLAGNNTFLKVMGGEYLVFCLMFRIFGLLLLHPYIRELDHIVNHHGGVDNWVAPAISIEDFVTPMGFGRY